MAFDLTVQTTLSQSSGGGGGGGDLTQMTFANPSAPTQAEVERVAQERWHTRPDWWANGTAPKIVGVDALPSEFSYNSGSNRIAVASNGGTLDGWDFAETYTQLELDSGDVIAAITNCTFAPEPITKADRVVGNDEVSAQPDPLTMPEDSTGRIQLMSRCWFRAHRLHEGGPFAPRSLIFSSARNGGLFPTIDVQEFCSFEGYGKDAVKAVYGGIRRGCYFDPPWNIPDEAVEWSSSLTYNRGDVVFGPQPQAFLRMCMQDNTTVSPNFSAKNNSTTAWLALDPHSDLDQAPGSGDVQYLGCFFGRDQNYRRHPSRQVARGITSALRWNNFTQSNYGDLIARYNIFTRHLEAGFSTQGAISASGPLRSGKVAIIESNHHEAKLIQSAPGSFTVQNNFSGWTWWAPATLSAITASYDGSALTYGFSASVGGWATVVLSTSATPMTAEEIIYASVGSGGVLAKYEIDAPANTARSAPHSVALGAGTYYAHMLYQAGGGVDTIAAVQTVVV